MKLPIPVFLSAAYLLSAFAHPAAAAPDEDILGKAQGYPIGTYSNWYYDESTRVGSFSNLDHILPSETLEKAQLPTLLRKAAGEPDLRYDFKGKSYSVDDFLQHQRITGLLILKDGEILVERYQYDRTPNDRLTSHSMAKSITSLAIGFALEDKKIASLDDKVSKYVPELTGYPYGEISLRNVLRMSSGVKFTEDYSGNDDLQRFNEIWFTKGLVAGLQSFTEREAKDGERFHYATSQTFLLGLVVKEATGKSLSAYIEEKLWKPMGAEAVATWAVDMQGNLVAGGNFNAVLRDYGRLGTLLAYDGMLNGIQILPKSYLMEATDWHQQPEAFRPGKATGLFGYGYQFWILPGEKRRFVMMGVYGQMIYVDPEKKLVMVHTGVAKNANIFLESMGSESYSLWSGLESRVTSLRKTSSSIPVGVSQLLERASAAWANKDINGLMAQFDVDYRNNGKDLAGQRVVVENEQLPFTRRMEWKITDLREEGNIAYVKAIVQPDFGQVRVETQFIRRGDRWYFYGNRR